MDIRLYNTLTRQKEVFVPADPERVTMYVCGPTVYNRAHIGNARPAVVFDVLARLLRHKYGTEHVVYARNITDIEDKIIAAAAAEGVLIETITARYEQHYLNDMGALGVTPPDLAPHATHHVPQMVTMIAGLVERGHAYAADGHVLFDVPSWPDYGKLSRRPMDEMIAGARVEVAPYKRSPADFVLWKPSTDAQPGWDSPWGRGRPGWHIECSAMIEELFGDTIDIHAGGIDLQFPHHENEIAQSVCAHDGAPLAKVWLHNGFLDMRGEKMSKSLGNVTLVEDLLAAGHRGEVLRLALLMGHYRQPLDWTEGLIAQAKARWTRWARALDDRDLIPSDAPPEFIEALADDLNTPQALSVIEPFVRSDPAAAKAALRFVGLTLPTDFHDSITESLTASDSFDVTVTRGEPWIDQHVAARAAARARKDFAESDRIRDELAAEGIVLEDGPSGTTWRRA